MGKRKKQLITNRNIFQYLIEYKICMYACLIADGQKEINFVKILVSMMQQFQKL